MRRMSTGRSSRAGGKRTTKVCEVLSIDENATDVTAKYDDLLYADFQPGGRYIFCGPLCFSAPLRVFESFCLFCHGARN